MASAIRSRTLSPACAAPGDVGADGVNDHVRAQRHVDRFLARDVAHVVVAIAEQDDRPAHRPILLLLQQLVAAGKIQRIVHGGAAAGPEGTNPAGKRFGVVGKILGNLRGHIEADHESLVVSGPHRLVEKFDGGFLLELETVAHRIAGIHHQPDLEGQIGLVVEAADLLGRLAVVEYRKIALGQILYVAAMFVGDREHHIHFVDRLGDRGGGIIVGGFEAAPVPARKPSLTAAAGSGCSGRISAGGVAVCGSCFAGSDVRGWLALASALEAGGAGFGLLQLLLDRRGCGRQDRPGPNSGQSCRHEQNAAQHKMAPRNFMLPQLYSHGNAQKCWTDDGRAWPCVPSRKTSLAASCPQSQKLRRSKLGLYGKASHHAGSTAELLQEILQFRGQRDRKR